MTSPKLLELAIRIAVTYHAGQLDKAGMPYILHPLRVMNAANTIDEKNNRGAT
jgi:guanosine-3',5'-bis(diphosphate) 3'-pyrophosphohydrolase